MPDIPLPKPQAPTPPPVPNPSPAATPQAVAASPTANLPKPPAPPMPAPPTVPTAASPAPAAPIPKAPPPVSGQVAPANPNLQKPGQKKPAQFAQTKASPVKKFLPFIIGGVAILVVAVVAMMFLRSRGQSQSVSVQTENTDTSSRQTVPAKTITLTYWGLWEPSEVMTAVFKNFESQNPGIKIEYVKQSHQDYRTRLQNAIATGTGPDLFRYHATWVPMLKNELAAMPSNVMSASEYQQTFYPIAASLLQNQGQIVGIPLMYDGLALFYNKKVLSDANVEPPKTWAELKSLASKLTIKDSKGQITRSGLAIGNASNTEHFADILGLLILQNGGDPSKASSKAVQEALLFYTNFINQDGVYDDQLPNSTVAFARGDAAMMLAPSWRAHEVMAINSLLDFATVSAPTLGDQRITWASFWAEGVSAKSKNSKEAWALLKYLSSKEVMQQLYNAQSQVRTFGEIYSRVDLADSLATNDLVTAYLQDAPYATSWYLASFTHDNGLNDNLIKYYKDAINSLLDGKSVEKVTETLDLGVKQVLQQYNLN